MIDYIINISFMACTTILFIWFIPKYISNDKELDKINSIRQIIFSEWTALRVGVFSFIGIIISYALYGVIMFVPSIFGWLKIPYTINTKLWMILYYPTIAWLILIISVRNKKRTKV